MPASAQPAACPHCGGARNWHGVCPRCVLGGALRPVTATPAGPAPCAPGLPGGYELLGEIGRGGMGIVWRARQHGLSRDVAIKSLRPGAGDFPGARDQLRREARATARLAHPGIVPIHDVVEAGAEVFLVMELVEGQTLDQRLQSGPLPPRAAAMLLREVADAIQDAHEHGVIHRDLKPANILLDRNRGGAPRLTDFGIAHFASPSGADLTATLFGLGTLGYLAPEQASGRRGTQGTRTDIHGLGAVLYHCLTGHPPFRGESPAAVLRAVTEQPPPPLREVAPAVSRDLETVCLHCLEKDPHRRYATAADLRADLDRFLRGEPVLARPVSRLGNACRRARNHPAVGAWMLIAASLAGILAWNGRRNPGAGPGPGPGPDPGPAPPPSAARMLASWPVRHPDPPGRIPLSAPLCSALAFSPDGRWLVIGDEAGKVLLLPSGRRRPSRSWRLPSGVRSLAWSADSRWLVGADEAGTWRLWEATGNVDARDSQSSGSRIDAVGVNPDGSRFFTSHHDGQGRLWRREGRTTALAAQFDIPGGVWGASFNADGSRLLTICPLGLIDLRDGRSGDRVATLADHAFPAAAFRPTGSHVALARTNSGPGIALHLVRSADGREDLPPIPSDQPITAFAFSPDGGRLVVATSGQVRILPVEGDRGNPAVFTPEHPAYLIRFAADGLRMLTSSHTGVVEMRDGHSGALLAGPIINPHLFWCTQPSPDGSRIAGGGADGFLHLWHVPLALPGEGIPRAAVVESLLRLGSVDALRRAAQVDPSDGRIISALVAGTRALGTPEALGEAAFLEARPLPRPGTQDGQSPPGSPETGELHEP